MNCANCGSELHGRYCARCGQDATQLELSLRGKCAELADAALGLDSRVGRTVRALSIGPGDFVRAWVDGRRAQYVTPLRYLLGTCAAWFAARALALRWLPPQEPDATLRPELVAVQQLMQEWGQLLNLACVPLLVPCVALAFRGARVPLLAHACLLAYAFGHLFLLRALLELVVGAVPALQALFNAIDPFAALAYWTWAFYGFHRGRVAFALPRALLAVLLVFAGSIALNLAFVSAWLALH